MKIQEVKLSRSFLFFGKEVVIITSDGKTNLKVDWDSTLVDNLNLKLKNFKIETLNDFSKLKETLKDLDIKIYSILENGIFNSIKVPWKFVDSTVKQIPRPMNVVLKKQIGIAEFIVFSLNANSFDAALNANRSVVDYLAKNLSHVENMKEEQILMFVKEAVDKEHELINFELRVGVVFNNFLDGIYKYKNADLDTKKQFDFVAKLIESYGVSYVENPFSEADLDSYKELMKKYRSKCLISINSKINEYSRAIGKGVINTLFVKYSEIDSFKKDVEYFSDMQLNMISEPNEFMDLVVGLRIPLIKLNEDKISNDSVKKLQIIAEQIKNNNTN